MKELSKDGTMKAINNNESKSLRSNRGKFFVIKNSPATSICTSIHTLLNYWDLHTRE